MATRRKPSSGASAPRKRTPRKSKAAQKDSAESGRLLSPEVLPAEKPHSAPRAHSGNPSPRKKEEIEDVEYADESEESFSEEDLAPSDTDLESEAASQYPVSQEAAASETLDQEMRAVSPTDPLRRYMEEARRHPLLSPEEEIRLATRLRDEGDLDAAKRLVQANLRLVVKIAFEYRSFYSNILDLIQEGNVGLMKAVSKFDPTKGARLGYYSSWWIRSYILKYILDNFRLVKIGTTQAQKKLFYHLMREKQRLEAQGLLAGPKLLAEKLDVREKDVIEMQERLSGRGVEMALDAPRDSNSESGNATHLDYLAADQAPADEIIAHQELLQILEGRLPEFRERLNEKERRLLEERLLADDPKTLQEVADHYGLSRERARQIEVKVIQKLKDFLASEFGNS